MDYMVTYRTFSYHQSEVLDPTNFTMWNFSLTYTYQKSSIYAAFRTPVIKKSGFYGNFSRKTPPITEPAAPPPHGSRRSGSAATRHRSIRKKSVIKEKVVASIWQLCYTVSKLKKIQKKEKQKHGKRDIKSTS